MTETVSKMINDFESKSMFATLETHYNPGRRSNCCGAPVAYDSDICSKCGEHCSLICSYCDGEGEIIDRSRINSTTINIPYARCPECGGDGEEEA